MPMDYNADVNPRDPWPTVGTTVWTETRNTPFTVVGYAQEPGDDGVALVAALRHGQDGEPGLWRLVRDGDDALVQYHDPFHASRQTTQNQTRAWQTHARLCDWFDGDADDTVEGDRV